MIRNPPTPSARADLRAWAAVPSIISADAAPSATTMPIVFDHRGQQAVSDARCVLFVTEVLGDHQEGVTVRTADDIARSQSLCESRGVHLDQRMTDRPTVYVGGGGQALQVAAQE